MSVKKTPPRSDFVSGLIRDGYLAADFDQLPRPSSEEAMADEALSIRLLAGFDVDSGRTSFLKQNGPEERQAREALARLVRDKMKGFSGELLALAIDPRTLSPWQDMKPTRRIRFESPGRGKSSTLMRDKRVVDFIRSERRRSNDGKLEPCLSAAEEHFKLCRSRVHAIWKAHEDMLKAAASTK
jgi:hypothetical protein